MTLQILRYPKYVADPEMVMLLRMTNYVVGNITQQLKEAMLK